MPAINLIGRTALLAGLAVLLQTAACAADWSDTYLGYRYGTHFGEPFESNNISKNIFNLNHVSGYKYGTNFFNVDILMANSKDPVAPGSSDGSQEVYIVYRHTLDLGKVSGANLAVGPFRGFGLTAGFDANTKDDSGYNSRKRMLVMGPTAMFDVTGFLNMSVLAFWESNAPYNKFSNTATPRYRYKTHPALDVDWGLPFNVGVPLSFNGYMVWIASKGRNEFGGPTAPETHFDGEVMYTVDSDKHFKVGLEYEYWRNKFGNPHDGPAGSGAFAKTPMVRGEYHF
ncbi:MAG: outer envelope protein [Burkholderiales bacterium]|nr:outer envelope protein [Burkholderiales bacterium]